MKKLSNNLVQIASILSDLKYHDGDSIGMKLGITRSAVWKSIKKLELHGVKVISVKNKGYALNEPLLLLNQSVLKKAIPNSNLEIEVFENIDSTSNYLKSNLDLSKTKICIAEVQTNGRGRMGRTWHSPFGQNIYLSYAYHFKKDLSQLNGLSLVVGIAVLSAIKENGIDVDLKLKWPNDAIYKDQKLIGTLVELQSESYSYTTAIIGIGINVNMLFDTDKITQNWTSLKQITGKYIDRNQLCIALIHNLNFFLEQFAKYGLKEFLSKWFELDALYNQNVIINNGEYQGISKGINEFGNLLLELPTGEMLNFSVGEVSIRKAVTR